MQPDRPAPFDRSMTGDAYRTKGSILVAAASLYLDPLVPLAFLLDFQTIPACLVKFMGNPNAPLTKTPTQVH